MKAQTVAEYLVSFYNSKGDEITNKKLQKLLYYTEAWNLVYFDSIIDEDFQAWVHGPVIPYVYGNFKKFGYLGVQLDYRDKTATSFFDEISSKIELPVDQNELLHEIIFKYGALTSFELELLTHSEPPWLEARKGLASSASCSENISKELMKNYYSSLVSDGK